MVVVIQQSIIRANTRNYCVGWGVLVYISTSLDYEDILKNLVPKFLLLFLLFSLYCLMCEINCERKEKSMSFVTRVIFLLVLYCRIFLWNIYFHVYVSSSYLTFHVFRHLCSQANGSAMKAGGNSKHAFLALPVSKIPAFIPSSWKHSSTRAARSRLTNQTSSSSSKSSIPCLSLSWPSCRPVSPSQRPEGQNLTLPPQTQNGKSCSYSYSSSSSSSSYSSSSSVSPNSTSSSSSPSSPSLLSPTAMCRGGGAVHMPSFSSRRSLKASSDQAAITPASFTGNMA